MERAVDTDEPWYRNPWVWLVIAIPSLTVIGCAVTLYLAIVNPHILVSDAPSEYSSSAGSSANGSQ